MKKKEPISKVDFVSVLLMAAGTASRMQGTDKILYALAGKPVLCYSLETLCACPWVDAVVIVTREDLILPIADLCKAYGFVKVTSICTGGSSRMESVQKGLRELSPRTTLLAIHDGARPFLPPRVLEEVLELGWHTGAAAPALPLRDTIKAVAEADHSAISHTVPRELLRAVQTPQVFSCLLYRMAMDKAQQDGKTDFTDDCSLVEYMGQRVSLTQGSEMNRKITTPEDLDFAEFYAMRRAYL